MDYSDIVVLTEFQVLLPAAIHPSKVKIVPNVTTVSTFNSSSPQDTVLLWKALSGLPSVGIGNDKIDPWPHLQAVIGQLRPLFVSCLLVTVNTEFIKVIYSKKNDLSWFLEDTDKWCCLALWRLQMPQRNTSTFSISLFIFVNGIVPIDSRLKILRYSKNLWISHRCSMSWDHFVMVVIAFG